MDIFKTLIKEICDEENIEFSILSKDWVIMLRKGNKVKFIIGNKFDLNTHASGLVFDDKYATYEVLKSLNIPIIEHNIYFKDYELEDVLNYFHSHDNSIVIKTNDGSCGTGVFHITIEDEIEPLLHRLFIKHMSVSICPFYNIKHEYRMFMINNECVLMYGKNRPIVYGDGIHTIKELLIEFNPNYFKDILVDEEYNSVLEKGEKYEYGWQFNLSRGSVPFEVEDEELKRKLIDLSKSITSKLDLGFCSLDIIDSLEGLYVIEINSGTMMKNYIEIVSNGREIAKEIYRSAIKSMFNL